MNIFPVPSPQRHRWPRQGSTLTIHCPPVLSNFMLGFTGWNRGLPSRIKISQNNPSFFAQTVIPASFTTSRSSDPPPSYRLILSCVDSATCSAARTRYQVELPEVGELHHRNERCPARFARTCALLNLNSTENLLCSATNNLPRDCVREYGTS